MNVVITTEFNKITIVYNDSSTIYGRDEVSIYGSSISDTVLVDKNESIELWLNSGETYIFSYDNSDIPIVDTINGVAPSSLQNLYDILSDLVIRINKTDTATVTDFVKITVNTAVTASASNEDRTYWSVTIKSKDAYIRFMPSTTQPSERKGIFIKKDQIYEMPIDKIYTGEISIINKKNNEKPEYSVTTY